MPLQRSETYTTTGTKGSWNCDPSIAAFSLNIAVLLSAGGVCSYSLQYSYDSLDDPTLTDSNATWFDSDDLPAGTTGSGEANFNTPIYRVRLVIVTLTAPATLTMKMLQGMSVN